MPFIPPLLRPLAPLPARLFHLFAFCLVTCTDSLALSPPVLSLLSLSLSSFIGSKLKSKPGRGPRPLSRLYCATTLRFHACDPRLLPRFHLPSPPFFPLPIFLRAGAKHLDSVEFLPPRKKMVFFFFFFFFVTVPRIESDERGILKKIVVFATSFAKNTGRKRKGTKEKARDTPPTTLSTYALFLLKISIVVEHRFSPSLVAGARTGVIRRGFTRRGTTQQVAVAEDWGNGYANIWAVVRRAWAKRDAARRERVA